MTGPGEGWEPGEPPSGWDLAPTDAGNPPDWPAELPDPDDPAEPAADGSSAVAGAPELPADRPSDLPAEPPVDWSASPPDAAAEGVPADGAGDDRAGDGTDPAAWGSSEAADPFPPALEVDVAPTDGGPWVDPDLLGAAGADGADWSGTDPTPPTDPPSALLADLAAADGADPAADWPALAASDDPAVSALARFWR